MNRRKFIKEGAMGVATIAIATVVNVCVYGQDTTGQAAAKAPESFNPKVLQFSPKNLNIEYLAPWEKEVTQAQLKKDSASLVKQIDLFNQRQKTPNGWDGKPVTAEEVYKIINRDIENFVVDKIRYQVATGQIPKPPSDAAAAGAAPGVQLKLGKVERIERIERIELEKLQELWQ